ncbi:unnamed protein product [Vicia faba]|uniref:Uncharacterized protein n=1 Tax=Vicia faba TaxID=3906 RepID=A0AAV0YLJ1_VICFA|nr:unnamed protein product [Vicia faba]
MIPVSIVNTNYTINLVSSSSVLRKFDTQSHLRFRPILFIFICGPLGFDSMSSSDASLTVITKTRKPVIMVLKWIMEEDAEDVDCEDMITLKLEEDA